jgi:hypothetical protein
MVRQSFITSRWGRPTHFGVSEYFFTPELNQQEEQKAKFCNWLKKNPDIHLYQLTENSFSTFNKLNTKKGEWQYNTNPTFQSITSPFENTSLVSTYLGKLLRDLYSQQYEQFLNKNIFVVHKLERGLFQLLKCVEFNVEVFPNGEFLIHLIPSSKIIGSAPVSEGYLRSLITSNQNNKEADNMVFRLIDRKRFKSRKFDLLDDDCLPKVETFIQKRKNIIASFDYHFVANHSPNTFGWINENTSRDLKSSVEFLIPISQMINLPGSIDLHDKPFFEVEANNPIVDKNLLVGGNKRVNLQSAAYHDGIYQPVNGKIIQPVVVGNMKIDLFYELLMRFNKHGSSSVKDPIYIPSNEDVDKEPFEALIRKYGRNFLLCIFSRYMQPQDFFDPIRKLRLQYQIYHGEISPHQLSNYVVKCLEKLGGLLSIISNTFEPDDTYFVGVDLGHTTNGDEKFSNLGVVFYDNHGRYLTHNVVKELPRNEAINQGALTTAMKLCIHGLRKRGLAFPKKIIIHRDGKMHKQDYEVVHNVITQKIVAQEYDVVEIIKSGYPVIACHKDGEYCNLESGNFWLDAEHCYAILVTNTQSTDVVRNPIIIKHAYGNTPFERIVDQVYSFTKVYTNNLYNSTRLPATTEKANNVVGTGKRKFVSSYLG